MKEKGLYINRELSWLKFNERVLEEAEREEVPLCERLNFLSIYQSNLDEFFMVRVGSLAAQTLLSGNWKGSKRDNKTHMTAEEQLRAVLTQVRRQNGRAAAAYALLLEELKAQDIRLLDFQKLEKADNDVLEAYFDREIAALLSPVIVGRRQPFPFLKSREIYAAAVLIGKNGKEKLGLIPCGNDIFPRLASVRGKAGTYLLSEELILKFIAKVFRGYQVKDKALLRITRNTDMDTDAFYGEDLDYREFMADIIKRRKRLAPVRLELSRELSGSMEEILCQYAAVERKLVFHSVMPLDLSFLSEFWDLLRQKTELFFEKRIPRYSGQFDRERSILRQIREKDKLLAYPYHSIKPFLEMLKEAAYDDQVISIKMTLYRVARQSKVVEALIEAAENGREVLVLVELKARFDEENNIEWSRRLEKAGCRVLYGLDGYKVHSKLCLITRRTKGRVEYYTQIGTGNYNENTARLYTDLSLMTADWSIGRNAAALFQALALGEITKESGPLMVAPECLQTKVLEQIDEEIARAQKGEMAYIGLKLNSLTDKTIIDRLIAASRAKVTVDMVIRGICCLRPGVEKETDHIRVISIVGRFLEHSRVYIFGTGERQKVYISSADLMTRNTKHRVEVAAPVYDLTLRRMLAAMFSMMLKDNVKARELQTDGTYVQVRNDNPFMDSQDAVFCFLDGTDKML